MSDGVTSIDGTEHEYEVGAQLGDTDWEISNRMIDVDTNEVLYRIREVGLGVSNEVEIVTESQLNRRYADSGAERGGSGDE